MLFKLLFQVLGVGYAVHYFPYFLVDRTLFLHHYMPAYLFKVSGFILLNTVCQLCYIFQVENVIS